MNVRLKVARFSTPHSDHKGTGEALWAQMIARECRTRIAAGDGYVTTCEHVTSDTPILIPAWAPLAVCFFCTGLIPDAEGIEADTCDGCRKVTSPLGDVFVNLGRATVMGALCWECWHEVFPNVPKPPMSWASPIPFAVPDDQIRPNNVLDLPTKETT
jgi:hypothetical protein